MSLNTERAAIESRLATNWSTTPIRWDNVPFPEQTSAYVVCDILDGEGNQISLGDTPRLRYVNLLILRLFVPEATGTATARTYADQLGAIFSRVTLPLSDGGWLRCRVASPRTIGVRAGWHQTNITIPFFREEKV
jgi:hypothetical protein